MKKGILLEQEHLDAVMKGEYGNEMVTAGGPRFPQTAAEPEAEDSMFDHHSGEEDQMDIVTTAIFEYKCLLYSTRHCDKRVNIWNT